MIEGKIMKNDTNYRMAIPARERLRFLATGNSYHSLMGTSNISRQCISEFIPEVFDAIILSLKDYAKVIK